WNTPGIGPEVAIKVYVLDGGRDGNRRPDAGLDGAGGKPVPNLCVTCHATKPLNVKQFKVKDVWTGGKFNVGAFNTSFLRTNLDLTLLAMPIDQAASNITFIQSGISTVLVADPPDGDVGGRFLPFDLESFTYSDVVGVLEAQFRELNRGIYLYTPLTKAMTNLLEGWYGGALNAANNNAFSPGFVPADWAAEPALYRDVVKVSCRACHITRAGKLGFASADDFIKRAGLEAQICSRLTMPNAQRNFSIFWGSQTANFIKPGAVPNQIAILTNKFDWSECPTAR
ncbi:MAG: hypothetical protein H7Y43_05140, partial [Akkermansiaceae bacterium]|nr:hypothetical protein [Verrucomicrobiales bacterium]